MANPHVPGLTDSGWQAAGSCMCQGSLKYKYAKRFPRGLAIIKVPASGVPRWEVEWFDSRIRNRVNYYCLSFRECTTVAISDC